MGFCFFLNLVSVQIELKLLPLFVFCSFEGVVFSLGFVWFWRGCLFLFGVCFIVCLGVFLFERRKKVHLEKEEKVRS